MNFKIGDSVKVKLGVLDPDFHDDLSNYQGRIIEEPKDDLISIQWDSHTLKNIPHTQIKESEQQGLYWDRICLSVSELELTTPRDTQKEVDQAIDQLKHQFFWSHLGEAGDRISSVLSGLSPDDDLVTALNIWLKHLKKSLTFPFQAEVSEWQETGPLECDEKITVIRLAESTEIDSDYGLFMEIKNERVHVLFPLFELEVTDKQSKNFTPVNDYATWFANR